MRKQRTESGRGSEEEATRGREQGRSGWRERERKATENWKLNKEKEGMSFVWAKNYDKSRLYLNFKRNSFILITELR